MCMHLLVPFACDCLCAVLAFTNFALREFVQIPVEAYGDMMPLEQVAQVVSKNPRLVTVNVFDNTIVNAVDKVHFRQC